MKNFWKDKILTNFAQSAIMRSTRDETQQRSIPKEAVTEMISMHKELDYWQYCQRKDGW